MTDIGGGIFSLVVTAIFLRFWKPKEEWHFDQAEQADPAATPRRDAASGADDPHAAEAAALRRRRPGDPTGDEAAADGLAASPWPGRRSS